MKSRIWRAMGAIVLIAILLFGAMTMGMLYPFFTEQIEGALDDELRTIAAALEQSGEEILPSLGEANADSRLTWISEDGEVLFDSRSDAQSMENHLHRPEVEQALQKGVGGSIRRSDTLGVRTIYRALRMGDGSVLRISEDQSSIAGLLLRLLPFFAVMLCLTFFLIALVSKRVTQRIVQPINALDLNAPADNVTYPELTPLLKRMAEQMRSIDRYIAELTAQKTEFAAITQNMREALLLLNARGEIVFLNHSATEMFGVEREKCEGQYLLALSRNMRLSEALEAAKRGESFSEVMERNGRQYQLIASPVQKDGEVTGVVLLLPDISARVAAEKSRREFTANVSHELKTPLTIILGYAEIMENGIAGEDKLREFAGRVHQEAERMLAMIEDILKLSRLDEGRLPDIPRPVALKALCERVARRFEEPAKAADLTIRVEGEEAEVQGQETMLEEVVTNLVDNAVKYNRPGGSVEITIARSTDGVRLCVRDSGVGIPKEYQQRVFERFFRVDQSHSDSVKGTGLGLSIVKHAAALHRAEVTLESQVGKGTAISLRFPLPDQL